MPVVYIHIGQHRTGTTSLQNFLTSNRKALYDKGIIYPEFLKPASSHFFAWHFGFGNRKLSDNENEQVKAILQKTIRIALEHSKDILVSSEILFSGINKSALKKIREQFRGFNVKIICYLRRQDEYILSYYTQFIKQGNTLDVKEFINRRMFRWYHPFMQTGFNWYKKLKPYANVFGKKNIIVRPFEKQQLEGGNVISDFLKLTGIDKHGLIFSNQYDNVSLPAEGVQILRYLNSIIPKNCSTKDEGQKIMPYAEILEKYYSRYEPWHKQAMGSSKRKAIVKRFAKGNRKIAKEFLGREKGNLFQNYITENNFVHESVDMNQHEIIQHLVEILLSQHQEIKYLRRK